MTKEQLKRHREIMKMVFPNMKDWKKKLAHPVINLALSLRKDIGPKSYKKLMAKPENKDFYTMLEYIATGNKNALKMLKTNGK